MIIKRFLLTFCILLIPYLLYADEIVSSGSRIVTTPSGGAGGAPTDATYITQTPDGDLSAEQALNALSDGLLKHTSGVVGQAVADTDYLTPTGDGSSLTGIAASQVSVALGTGSPTIDQVQEYLDNTGSSGYFTGGALSDGGAGTLDVAAGEGFIRDSASDNAPLKSFKWSASSGIAVTDNTTQYVFVDEAGTISLNSNEFLEAQDLILIGLVTDESAAIENVFNLGVRLEESIGQAGRFMRRVHGIVRDNRRGGLIFGQSGDANRDVTVTTGHLLWGRSDYTISAFDTSGADVFDTYSAGGQEASGASGWDNDNYDNSGTLTTLGANKWAVLWFYIEPDDEIVMVYGRNEYNSEALAEAEILPNTSLPNRVADGAVSAARYIFQKSANSATISSAFDIQFAGNGVTDHGNLAGLLDDDHTQYLETTDTYADGNAAGGDALVSIASEITDNEATNEENPVVFVAGADPDGGDLPLETDGDFTYNPSTGGLTVGAVISNKPDGEHGANFSNSGAPTGGEQETEGDFTYNRTTDKLEVWDGVDRNKYYISNEDSASATAEGIVELATPAETTAGTDAGRSVTPDGLAGSDQGKRVVSILVNNSTALTTGDGKAYLRIPPELNGYDLVYVAAAMVAGTAEVTFDIYNFTQSTDTLTTALTIDANETDSSTAAVAAVINTAEDNMTTADRLRIDATAGGTGTTWSEVQMVFQLP